MGGALGIVVSGACGGDDLTSAGVALDTGPFCTVNQALFYNGGVPKDGIPALTDPEFVDPDDPSASYLDPSSRIIGLEMEGQVLAIPHNILWWHEIVNLNVGEEPIVVTYCPLTGSSVAFDRAPVEGAEFGVSGLLFLNNLVMYDRRDLESLWPQLAAGAVCGPKKNTPLPQVAVREFTWGRWLELYPETRVLSSRTGFDRNYRQYPYGSYEDLYEKPFVPIGGDPDPRRPPKERVLGLVGPEGQAIAFPFLALDAKGPVWAENVSLGEERYVVFWDRAGETAVGYGSELISPIDSPVGPSGPLTFEMRNGEIVDVETGSVWNVKGGVVRGALEGSRLEPAETAVVSFWFAWAAFHPQTVLWEG
ncbi:MAG: DUF3179 domain-containing protein [Gemmatimonadota bacterium]